MFLSNQYLGRGDVQCIQCTTKNNKMSKLIQCLRNFLDSLCDVLKFLSELHEQLLHIGLGRLRGLSGNPCSSGRSMWDCHAIESDMTGRLGCYPLALSVWLSGIEIYIGGSMVPIGVESVVEYILRFLEPPFPGDLGSSLMTTS